MYKCFTKNIHVIHLDKENRSVVESLLRTMLNEFQKQDIRYNDYIKTALVQLLLVIMRLNPTQTEYAPHYKNSTHRIVDESIGYINNNFHNEITLESMSKMFFVTPPYFSKIFKESTGLTFVEYLNNVRIKEAQKLLATTKLSINEICERTGFNSNTHFCRIFKKLAGTSPSAYRKLDDI